MADTAFGEEGGDGERRRKLGVLTVVYGGVALPTEDGVSHHCPTNRPNERKRVRETSEGACPPSEFRVWVCSLGALIGCLHWVPTLGVYIGCLHWVPTLGALIGCPHWVPTFGARMGEGAQPPNTKMPASVRTCEYRG